MKPCLFGLFGPLFVRWRKMRKIKMNRPLLDLSASPQVKTLLLVAPSSGRNNRYPLCLQTCWQNELHRTGRALLPTPLMPRGAEVVVTGVGRCKYPLISPPPLRCRRRGPPAATKRKKSPFYNCRRRRWRLTAAERSWAPKHAAHSINQDVNSPNGSREVQLCTHPRH